ncbi:MAG TPA: DUF1428 family protein, partial [Pyrinomonadaceae bacterium]|nr:DUF1428 family protein [Pyrinomonadaceae bacterium]
SNGATTSFAAATACSTLSNRGTAMAGSAWIVFKSRKHRDEVNKKVMADPRLNKMMEKGPMPFDIKRMAYGGFNFIVDA